ncbi:hypothetical protein CY35_14G073800 [Sphagnum magellanicum]|nr:hypothetical protein CY35_14G073800 [Sphagnum magellanicum]
MARCWWVATKQGLNNVMKWANLSVVKESCQQGEALAGFRWKANPFNEYRFQPSLATVAAAGLLLCMSSGALRPQQSSSESHSKEEEELYAAPAVLKSLCGVAIQEWEAAAAAEKIRPSMSSCCRDSKESGMPVLKVNALPLSRAHSIGTEPAALKEPSSSVDAFPSRRGDGCLSRYAIADAAAIAAPAVVNVKVSLGRRHAFFGETAGSGFIIQSDGTILTNAHVVANERRGLYKGALVVTLQDGRNFEGEVVSFDSLSDIAVIKVNSPRPLPTAKLGSSKDLRPGEWVVALGSPLHLQNTVTAGIISCVDRKSSEIGLEGVGTGYIQIDAAINQGNSGGPLVNLDGEVIGINTMKALAADGVSFAIPIDSAIKIVEQLKKHRHVVRPWLGMKMWELTEPRILQLKERRPGFPDVASGVLVTQVIPGSPAARAGVWNDDVIVEFDGMPVTTINQIVEALGDKVGMSFKVVVKRAHGVDATLYVVAEEATPDL